MYWSCPVLNRVDSSSNLRPGTSRVYTELVQTVTCVLEMPSFKLVELGSSSNVCPGTARFQTVLAQAVTLCPEDARCQTVLA